MNMKQTLQRLFFVTALGTLMITSSCKKDDDPVPTPTPTPTPTVAGYVTADTSFSILLAAVSKAGLAGTLGDATKTWTVFAPTNAAFRAIGYSVASVNAITSQSGIDSLAAILTYHVLSIKVPSTGVPASDTVKTVNGKNLFASNNGNGVFVNGVKVVVANVPVSNGVIHAIGKVLIPPTQTIAQIVIAGANFSLLETAVIKAGLAGTLSGPGKFTVFAPENSGFPASLDTDAEINDPSVTVAAVAGIVTSHAFRTNIFAGDLVAGNTPATINPLTTLTIALSPASVKINGSANPVSLISTTDVVATNGVIHVINKLLQ
jgi:uncharacterized surface protein with fasciclin (FAS1) repeats